MAANMDNAPAPRLCHVIRWSDFDGYGFNLHSDKTRNGQFIGKVDLNSPAEAAGLKHGDRIVEVNGINIANENHKQVVERIKAIPKETRLLVVDSETDAWYRTNKVVVRGTQKNVIYLQNPASSDAKSSPNKNVDVKKAPPSPVFTPEIHSETVISNRKSSIESPSQSGADGRLASPVEDPRRRSALDDEHIQEVVTENHASHTSGASPPKDKSPKLAHQEKRSSITYSEHAPVTAVVPATDDHKKHHHEDGHHHSHAHHEKSDHHPDHAHHDKDRHDHHHHEKTDHSDDHTHKVHEHSPVEVYSHGHNFHREPSEVIDGDDMKETIHETRIISDGNEADRLASQLTGYRVLGEDIEVHPTPLNETGHHGDRRPSALADGTRAHSEHVHFENGAGPKHGHVIAEDDGVPLPRIWGATYEPSPVMERKEILEERVVHSPAFSPSTPVSGKEEMSEKVEVRKQNGSARNYSYNIEPNKDSLSDDSGSRSFSSAEAHSDKENGHRRNADDISDEQESKTPSPSPAVVLPVQASRSPAPPVRSTENGTVKPVSEKDKPFEKPAASTQKTSNYGNLALGLSVQEMRATLSRKKKPDPRNQQMDLRKKHDFINNM